MISALVCAGLSGCLDWRGTNGLAHGDGDAGSEADGGGLPRAGDAGEVAADDASSDFTTDDAFVPEPPLPAMGDDAAEPVGTDEGGLVMPDAALPDAALPDAGPDAALPDAAMLDAGPDAATLDAGPDSGGGCVQSACPDEYPCVGTATDFTCRGQYADFPLPSRTAGQNLSVQKLKVDVGAGTVLDEVTGLMWERVTHSVGLTYSESNEYCSTLTNGGHGGWRLPSVQDLASLSGGDPVANVDTTVFIGLGDACSYWTSTRQVEVAGAVHWTDFIVTYQYGLSAWDDSGERCVLCVRTAENHVVGTPATRFQSLEGKTFVRDTITHLIWEAVLPLGRSAQSRTQADAHCASLSYQGRTFRLPTVAEALSIQDYSKPSAMGRVPPLFTMNATSMWTRSRVSSDANNTMFVAVLTNGSLTPLDAADETNVGGTRCVTTD